MQLEFINLHLGRCRITAVVSDPALPEGQFRRIHAGWETQASRRDNTPPPVWYNTIMTEAEDRPSNVHDPQGFLRMG